MFFIILLMHSLFVIILNLVSSFDPHYWSMPISVTNVVLLLQRL